MNLKNNVLISSKLVFKWTWRKRWYASTSSTLLNKPKIDENLNSFKKLKYPESMFVYKDDVASKYLHAILEQ